MMLSSLLNVSENYILDLLSKSVISLISVTIIIQFQTVTKHNLIKLNEYKNNVDEYNKKLSRQADFISKKFKRPKPQVEKLLEFNYQKEVMFNLFILFTVVIINTLIIVYQIIS